MSMKNKNKLRKMFPNENIPIPREAAITRTIIAGQDYIGRHIPAKTSALRLFGQQAKYISPVLLGTQFLVLLIVIATAISNEPDIHAAQNLLFNLAPLAAMLAIPELIKDVLFDMSELEKSCKNNSSVILLMRLIIIGSINIAVLLLLTAILAGTWGFNFLSLALYAVVPYNLVNIANLAFIRLLKIKGRNAVLVISFISAAAVYVLPNAFFITESLLLTAFVATTIILLVQIINMYRTIKGEVF